MTPITSVRIHRLSTPLVRPFITAVRRADSLESVVVEVRDDDGRSGWGEAPTSWRVTGESPDGVVSVIEHALAPAVMGRSADDPAGASRALARAAVGNNSARMAVDCALYDLAAQRAELPLWRYLGATSRDIRTDITLSVESDTDELLSAAREQVAAGFTTLKVKIGAVGPSASQLRALRDAVGRNACIRVDANQAWNPQQAVEIIAETVANGTALEFIEQPVPRDDIVGMVDVAAESSIPVLADESVWTVRQLRELLAIGRVGAVNIKLAKTGGIREALELAALATASGLGVVIGCMLESHVGISSAAALAAAVATPGPDGAARAQDLDGGLWLADSPVDGGVSYDGPRLVLPNKPGLGIGGVR